MKSFDRLTRDPRVMAGRICIRGMRITVDAVAAEIEARRTDEDILSDYPLLDREDLEQIRRFTAWLDSAREFDLSRA